jgi:hypothetical protein
MFFSGISLLYTAVVVPAQIFLWDYSDPCNTFPTLYLDVLVDSFFLVSHCETIQCASTFWLGPLVCCVAKQDSKLPVVCISPATHILGFSLTQAAFPAESPWARQNVTQIANSSPHTIPIAFRLQPNPLTETLPHQIEVACQFVIGTFDSTETYCDELGTIVTRYLTKFSGFWFDCVTSIPWSFMDLAISRVWPMPSQNPSYCESKAGLHLCITDCVLPPGVLETARKLELFQLRACFARREDAADAKNRAPPQRRQIRRVSPPQLPHAHEMGFSIEVVDPICFAWCCV